MSVERTVILGAARTPTGAFLGKFGSISATDLGAVAIRCALERAGVSGAEVDEVYMGIVVAAGAGQAPARQAALAAGVPMSVPCTTVNKMCGSGLKAVMIADTHVRAGESSLLIAGGMESMSNAPYLLRGIRTGVAFGEQRLEDSNLRDGLVDAYGHGPMGLGGEEGAAHWALSREDQDRFALRSYQRARKAQASGAFDDEIVPVEVRGKAGADIVAIDETPRETSLESLARLKPVFKEGGTVTAGNASKLSDGAAALVVASEARASALGATPLARVVAQAQFAGEPNRFLLAPAEAIRLLLKRIGWSVLDVDLFEVNEAFSGIEGARRELGIPEDRFNVNGGAIALGHPIGASGARLLVTLLYALQAAGKQRGVVSLCLAGGEAVALAVETV